MRGAVVQNVVAEVAAEVRAAFSALREAEAQSIKAEKKLDDIRRAVGLRKLELGRALVRARSAFPRSGPKAKGWGEFLEKEGLDQPRAWELMKLAGYVEVSSTSGGRADEMPTLREAGIDKRPRKGEEPAPLPKRVRVGFDLRLGAWQTVLADAGMVDAVISDTPYSERTHAKSRDGVREDGWDDEGLAPNYTHWTPADVDAFVGAWSPRCRGWMVGICDHHLIEAWATAYERHGRYAFAPVVCVIQGMSVRLGGDGPSSWAIYAMVSRPAHLSRWGTLPGAYVGSREPGAKNGRGKPRWLMDALVRDYTRPGDLVCDPLAGYGTTLISALSLGRRCIGAELDREAHEEAYRRSSSGTDSTTAA